MEQLIQYFNEIVPALVTLIPVAVIVSIVMHFSAKKRAAKDLTIKIHENYLDPDFYAKARAPAFHVGLQWRDLPRSIRSAYREAVIDGYLYKPQQHELSMYISHVPNHESQIITHHFQKPIGASTLTEHQALSAYLHFWKRLAVYKENNFINPKLTKKIFKGDFVYGCQFMNELADAVEKSYIEAEEEKPKWIDSIRELTAFFDCSYQKPNQGFKRTIESSAPAKRGELSGGAG
ncbi:MAG: hypothetical protein LAT56_15400 [Wenzhouxiangella sp.]|nr:hypothetical protein [Wenzhouxiangella sp.]